MFILQSFGIWSIAIIWAIYYNSYAWIKGILGGISLSQHLGWRLRWWSKTYKGRASVRISLMSFTGLSLVSTSQLFNTSLGSQLAVLFGMQKQKSKDFAVHSEIAKKGIPFWRRWNTLFTNPDSPTKFCSANSALHRICKPPTTRPNLAIARRSKDSTKKSHKLSLFTISLALYPPDISTCLHKTDLETMKGETAPWPCLLKLSKYKALGWIHSLCYAVIPVHKYESVNDDEILTDRNDGRPKFRKTSKKPSKNICNNPQ